MARISLLPPEIKKQREEAQRERSLIRIAIVFFIIILLVYLFLLVSTLISRGKLETLQKERQAAEKQIEMLQEYEDLYTEMTSWEDLVNQAMGSNTLWHDFLNKFGQILPAGVWLSDLTAAYSVDTGTVNIRGYGFNHEQITAMLDEVKTMEQLVDARIRVSTETTYQGKEAVQFNVEATLHPGPPYYKDDGDDKPEEENATGEAS